MGQAPIHGHSLLTTHNLQLEDVEITEKDLKGLSKSVRGLAEDILQIKLHRVGLSANGLSVLIAQHLPSMRKLETLDVSMNPGIGPEGIVDLSARLAEMKNTAVISPEQLRTLSPQQLIANMHSSFHLYTLSLNTVSMGNEGFSTLCEGLAENSTIIHVEVRDNGITDASPLSTLFARNSSIRLLDMGFNRIGNEGMGVLVDALLPYVQVEGKEEEESSRVQQQHGSTGCCLKYLLLQECGISDDGFGRFGDLLRGTFFPILDISDNTMSEETEEMLLDAYIQTFDGSVVESLVGLTLGKQAVKLGLFAEEWQEASNKEIFTYLKEAEQEGSEEEGKEGKEAEDDEESMEEVD